MVDIWKRGRQRERRIGNWFQIVVWWLAKFSGCRISRLLKVCQVENKKETKGKDPLLSRKIMYANGVSLKLSGKVKKKKRMSGGDMTRREIREIRSKGPRAVRSSSLSPHFHSAACLSLCAFFASHCFLCCLNLSGSKVGSSLRDRPRMVSLRRPDDLIFLTVFGRLGSLAASLRSPRDFSFLISRAIFSRVDPFVPLSCWL